MHPAHLLVIVFFSAFTGWFISWMTIKILFWPAVGTPGLQGIIPAKRRAFTNAVGSRIQAEFAAYRSFDEMAAGPALLDKLKPGIESHIDHFLKEKLKKVFPVLAQFMGEKTINQFKAAFLTEIDELLPMMIRNYMGELKNEIRLDRIIEEKMNDVSNEQLKAAFYQHSKKQRLYFSLACTGIGFITGTLTILILMVLNG